MSLYHGRWTPSGLNQPDPHNTIFKNWDQWCDWVWGRMTDDVILISDMHRASMLYAKPRWQQMQPHFLPPPK